MKKILVLGAGRSSSSLIQYLQENAASLNISLSIADASYELALSKLNGTDNSRAISFDVNNEDQKNEEIKAHDLIISLLPPDFHYPVALACLQHKKVLLTASYVSDKIMSLHEEAKKQGLLILMEAGLDPGIDHMSCMMDLQEIRQKSGQLYSFKSYTGGLIAPESDDNPWHYKFTWNPRNVVLAGQGTVKYLEEGSLKFIPYHQLFRRIENIAVDGFGDFEGYANRDSLKYIDLYSLHGVKTFLRGTLRKGGYCKAWNLLVQLGMTDDSYQISNADKLSYRAFTQSFLPVSNKGVEHALKHYLKDDLDEVSLEKLKWLGLLDDKQINISDVSPARIIQNLLEEKWKLKPNDKDMIVMHHQYEYTMGDKRYKKVSSLVVKGDDPVYTAMAKTVGLPLGIAAKLIIEDKIKLTGVHIPLDKQLYEPILKELKAFGIAFTGKEYII